MASFTAMQPLRRAVTQSRALQLRTLSYTAAVRTEARTGASSVSQRTTQSTGSSRGQNERDNQNRSSSRTPREGGPRNFEKRNRPNVATPPGIAQLLDTLATLKEEGRKPTAAAYVALISAAADYDKRRGVSVGRGAKGAGLGFEIALAAARDAEAGGIELGQEAINEFLKFSANKPEILPSLIIELLSKYTPTSDAYNTLAGNAAAEQRLEALVLVVVEMMGQNMWPDKDVLKHLILLCCEWGQPRLALDFIDKITANSKEKVRAESWVHVLMASADTQYHVGVRRAWSSVVANKAYTPDEGLVLAVLAVAGRWGDVQMAIDALSVLPTLGVQAKEHHLAPLLEAYCRDGKVPEAFKVVASMRNAGIDITLSTVKPIVDVLKTAEVVDQAFYTLEDQHKAGESVDIAIINAVIEASARQGDLQRARATQLAVPELGATPNIDTFNTILDACVQAKHRELGDTILLEMEKAEVKPDAETYSQMIRLCLTQQTYEDAFYFLEQMKGAGFRPTEDIYNRIGGKCAASNDGRWRLVADEMAALGYKKIDFEQQNEDNKQRRAKYAQSGQRRDGQRPQRDGQRQQRDGQGQRQRGQRDGQPRRSRQQQAAPVAEQ